MDSTYNPQKNLKMLFNEIKRLLKIGMQTGFFELRIVGEIAKGGQRRVQVLFSPSEQYTVSKEEINEH